MSLARVSMHEVAALAVVLLGCAAVAGCGPSVRRVRIADMYFERCWSGDRDERYTDTERQTCWQAWLDDYTVGQSDERIGHARERLLLLDPEHRALVEMATGEEEMLAESPLPVSEAPVVVLTGTVTGAELDPEERAPREETPELRERHRPATPRASTARCDATCLPPWEACIDACGDERGCQNACRMRFRVCANGCY